LINHLENLETVRDCHFYFSPGDLGDPPRVPILDALPAYPVKQARRGRKVLVVEDNLDSVHSLVMLLRQMGHTVDYAINGYAAFGMAKRLCPDFIFLDLGLPGLDGFEVCLRLKREPELKGTRIIAVTGYGQDEHQARSKAVGCELHLVKPVRPEVFEQLLA
jgi:CheY-like chemotaxis protein